MYGVIDNMKLPLVHRILIAERYCDLIISNNYSLREAASVFHISHTTLYRRIEHDLKPYNQKKYKAVRKVLDSHK